MRPMKLVRHSLLQALRLEIKLVTYVYNTEYRWVVPGGIFLLTVHYPVKEPLPLTGGDLT